MKSLLKLCKVKLCHALLIISRYSKYDLGISIYKKNKEWYKVRQMQSGCAILAGMQNELNPVEKNVSTLFNRKVIIFMCNYH